MISRKHKAMLHVYPALAGLSDSERRRIMLDHTGHYSAREHAFSNQEYESVMAAFETVLWERVAVGRVADPRLCRVCGRPLKVLKQGYGACPEGCERRKVYAWDPHYWRNRVIKPGCANSRLLHKLDQVWGLLLEYLHEDQRDDIYLAGIIAHAGGIDKRDILRDGRLDRPRLKSHHVTAAIEAIKDRLNYTVK